jgi:hypothetical protein
LSRKGKVDVPSSGSLVQPNPAAVPAAKQGRQKKTRRGWRESASFLQQVFDREVHEELIDAQRSVSAGSFGVPLFAEWG